MLYVDYRDPTLPNVEKWNIRNFKKESDTYIPC